MLINADVTLYNRRLEGGAEAYIPIHIRGVSWKAKRVSSMTERGLAAADEVSVRIPLEADAEGRAYVLPTEYHLADPAAAWTLRPGDWLVRGLIDKGLDLSAVTKDNPDVIQIKGVADNRDERSSPDMRHWRVTG